MSVQHRDTPDFRDVMGLLAVSSCLSSSWMCLLLHLLLLTHNMCVCTAVSGTAGLQEVAFAMLCSWYQVSENEQAQKHVGASRRMPTTV